MTKLIYGSTAMKHWFVDYDREPKDIDYINKNNHKKTKSEQHYWISEFQYILDNNRDKVYVDPDFLYTIKVSHASWDIKWEKTMSHIMFMRKKGCTLDKNLYKLLYKAWENIHGKKRVILNVSNRDFFKERTISHKHLHDLFKFDAVPKYELIIKNKKSPECCLKKWLDLSEEDKIKCALEEIYVFAAERYIMVNDASQPKLAKIKSLKNLITSATKGWFNIFLVENFEVLLYNEYDEHYLEKVYELQHRKNSQQNL